MVAVVETAATTTTAAAEAVEVIRTSISSSAEEDEAATEAMATTAAAHMQATTPEQAAQGSSRTKACMTMPLKAAADRTHRLPMRRQDPRMPASQVPTTVAEDGVATVDSTLMRGKEARREDGRWHRYWHPSASTWTST